MTIPPTFAMTISAGKHEGKRWEQARVAAACSGLHVAMTSKLLSFCASLLP